LRLPQHVLADGAATLGLALSPAQLDQFERYAAELIDWNQRANLTSVVDPLGITHKHFLDSLSTLTVCHLQAGDRIIDIGSGAGFPGLPIRIARPDLRLTLLEATRKKCDFLRHVAAALELADVTIINARAEDAARDAAQRERYDAALARAVADMATLAEYLLPFVRVGGWAIAHKSGDVAAEVERAGAALAALGGHVQRIVPVSVPGLDEARAIVMIEKVTPTPDKYPRRAGMPVKRPVR
jgi:16S rRNA (guanine527-N7)-methyltransferase